MLFRSGGTEPSGLCLSHGSAWWLEVGAGGIRGVASEIPCRKCNPSAPEALILLGCVCRTGAHGGSKWAQEGFEVSQARFPCRKCDPSAPEALILLGCVCRRGAHGGSQWAGYINKKASGEQIVKIGKYFGIGLAIASIIIAPILAQMQSIFEYLQKVNGLYSVPIIGIFILGIGTKHVPAIAAKIGMIVGMVFYAFFTFVNIKNVPAFFANGDGDLHWLHGYFISFIASVVVMLVIGYLKPKSVEEIVISDQRDPAPVDMTPWHQAKNASYAIMGTTIGIYLFLTWASG